MTTAEQAARYRETLRDADAMLRQAERLMTAAAQNCDSIAAQESIRLVYDAAILRNSVSHLKPWYVEA